MSETKRIQDKVRRIKNCINEFTDEDVLDDAIAFIESN